MEHLSKWTEYEEEQLFKTGLYAICEMLHMSRFGSADPIHPEEVEQLIAYLKKRIEEWTPSGNTSWKRFDDAVKEVVLAAIEEYKDTSA